MPPTSCVTGWDFRFGHAGTGKDLEVLGDVHPIFSCNSFATDFRSSVVSSRSGPHHGGGSIGPTGGLSFVKLGEAEMPGS